MKAMILSRLAGPDESPCPLTLADWPKPEPEAGEVLIKVTVCGVCHTELDEIEGRTPPPQLPVILGHQAVGRIVAVGSGVDSRRVGNRVGVAWIHSACGVCAYCQSGNENLCPRFLATGRDRHGGYAEYMTAPADFVYAVPPTLSDQDAAPLLCAGAVGYRSLRLTGLENGRTLGLTGFGASAHLVLMMARHRYPDSRVLVFARSPEERAFALELGASWAGDSEDEPPEPCAAIIDTTPVWKTVVCALKNLAPGGRLVINAIRKQEGDKTALLDIDYSEHLWMEKEIKSVANVARRDVSEFLAYAAEMALRPEVEIYPLEDANRALYELKSRRIRGAKVLQIG
ncbi:zinc-dependent alcohol dehydrogenase family protein [Methylococcus sp. EFPC2]|uniref:zinc-dependent alcohol dehydrogenase family protein n=1 Tax=Methylococcus sp. EFPC2 TaxID=2812648 RepID=UPI0019679567|nr:zinc-dependent alcohol dehydrogenase family protein [Methylococcus sp. EFPC2]QSA97939.1 zinc-dependent alcohol dehydrogenase family protein [Methylococcus sp. EFPC2]